MSRSSLPQVVTFLAAAASALAPLAAGFVAIRDGTRNETAGALAAFGGLPATHGSVYHLVQPTPYDACKPYVDSFLPQIRDKAVLIQRGGCSFVRKACMAQQAGAAAAVIYNSFQTDPSSEGRPPEPSQYQVTPINYPVNMFGITTEIRIPVVMIPSHYGVMLNQYIEIYDGQVSVNITRDAPPASCGATDRWPDDPLQCNSVESQHPDNRIPLDSWLLARQDAVYDVDDLAELARLCFSLAAGYSLFILILGTLRKQRFDGGQTLQVEQKKRRSTLLVAMAAAVLAAISYGFDQWGGECGLNHDAAIFLAQRVTGALCVIIYVMQVGYVNVPASDEWSGRYKDPETPVLGTHSNPFMALYARKNAASCGHSLVKLQVAALLGIEVCIAALYWSKQRSYRTYLDLAMVRLGLQFVCVLISHYGTAMGIFRSIFETRYAKHLGLPDDMSVNPKLLKRLATMEITSLFLQAVLLTAQLCGQVTLLMPGSYDFPDTWLLTLFFSVSACQFLQLWICLGIGIGLYTLYCEWWLRKLTRGQLNRCSTETRAALFRVASAHPALTVAADVAGVSSDDVMSSHETASLIASVDSP